MQFVTFCLLTAFVSFTSALPVLPLSVAGIERMEEVRKSDDVAAGRTFIVQVQEPEQQQKEQLSEKQPEQTREFPWPYPPVFEPYLPAEAKQRLNELYTDSTLNAEERATKVNAVFDELPQQVLESLPLPAEYERLPADVYRRISYIHVAPGFKWAERQQLIRDIVESLSDEEKRLMMTPRIGGPPPGFEYIIAPTVYKQLLSVHHNPRLSKEQKAELITRVMHQVPQDQLDRLPLPAGMDQLPAELQARLRALVYNYSVPQPVRAQRVKEFIQSLPEEIRPQLR